MKFQSIDPSEIDAISELEEAPGFEPIIEAEHPDIEPKAPNAHCSECPLALQPVVYGDGPDQADLIMVGEAPGRNEVKTGVPFIGKAGQLLNKVLSAHGIDRNTAYVTNAVLCWPGTKPGTNSNAQPSAKAIGCCRERLVTEIKGHAAKRVLALGAVAGKAVLNTKDPMNTMRLGGGTYSEELEAIVTTTFHPAASFYNPDLFPDIVSDIQKMATGHIKIAWEPTKYEVADNIGDGLRILGVQGGFKQLALDIETGKPYNRHNPRILCIGISHKPGHSIVYDSTVVNDPRFKTLLNDAFGRKDIVWVMQNGKEVDVQNLWGNGVPNARVDFDTLLAHYATDERKGTHALEQLGTNILGTPRWKKEVKDEEDDLEFLPREKLHQYNATDADVTHRLVEPLKKAMQLDGTTWTFDNLLMPGAMTLANMEYEGVLVNMDELVELDAILTERMEIQEKELAWWVDNPRSPPQIKQALLDLDFHVDDTTASTLKGIDHEFATRLLDYKKDQKLRSTYIRGLVKRICSCGRVHSDFLLHGTETGRTSSRRPNLQNQPPRTRPLFTASSPDNVLVEFDYSGIELRIAAILTGDPFLTAVMQDSKRNLHKEEATRIYGPDYTHEQYVRTKNVNFGIPYDRRAPAIAKQWVADMGMPYNKALKEATQLVKQWQQRSPKIWEYHAFIRDCIDNVGYIRTLFGNVRRFWFVNDDNRQELYREGYNFPAQAMGGYITLNALIKLRPAYLERSYSAKPVITVHDSIIVDMPKAEVAEVIPLTISIMEATPFANMPFPVEYKVGPHWQEEK